MRIVYFDIDSLRPDHLGCYGYHRDTSPNIDSIAAEGVRFNNCYVSDSPCLPSRTALFSGRFGIHNGVVGHGGTSADLFVDGTNRDFRSTLGKTNWMAALRELGYYTASISSFPQRHSAFHFTANFNETIDPGGGGNDYAHDVAPLALAWLARHADDDNWFLHINLWDPHTPYRTPPDFGNPFIDEPLPDWLTEDVRQRHWGGVGPHSAQEVMGFDIIDYSEYPLQPTQIASMNDVRALFDGYDLGVRYADEHIGNILALLKEQGIYDDTIIIVSADHGENLGELNIYGDHQTADYITNRVPLIMRMPHVQAGVEDGLIYHLDYAATLIELLGGQVPENWDGQSFAKALDANTVFNGRPYVVLSQGAWSCQRSVRFDNYVMMRSYHDGYHGFPDLMLFNIVDDPHEQHDLADEQPDVVQRGSSLLESWYAAMMRTSSHPFDPLWRVLHEGGPLHTRGHLPAYLNRLRSTGRAAHADALAAKHPGDLES